MLLKRFLIYIIVVFSFQNLFAGGVDSIQYIYVKLREIEVSIEENPQKAVTELDNLIRFSIKNNLDDATKYAYNLMGITYKELNQPKIALYYFKLGEIDILPKSVGGKEIKAKFKLSFSKSRYCYELAQVYALLEDYEKSNFYFKNYKSLIDSGAQKLNADYKIAKNYFAIEDYITAIELFEQVLGNPNLNWPSDRVNECHSFLAACYISIGEIEKGLNSYKKATLDFSEQYEDYEKSEIISLNMKVVSKALRKQNRYEEDISLSNTLLSSINRDNASLEHLRIAQAYYQAKNTIEAEASIDKYLKNKSYDVIDASEIEVIKQLAYDLSTQRNNAKAFVYLKSYNELKDSINQRLEELSSLNKELGFRGNQDILELKVLQKDKELSQTTINHLLRESDLQSKVMVIQKKIIYGLIVIVVLSVLVFWYVLRVSKQRRIANQKLALSSLRTQMNPHFIFNALNSVNSFISSNDDRSANKFLTDFSILMRSVMESSEHDFIPLSKEIEVLKIYTALEHFRFKDKFTYQFYVDESIDTDSYAIPPMMIQPYIENAIWHGLRYLKTTGELQIRFSEEHKNLKITIQDNGIGRKQSATLKTKNQKKNKSTALRNINERLTLLESLHKLSIKVSIQDLKTNGEGTLVSILIPKKNYEN